MSAPSVAISSLLIEPAAHHAARITLNRPQRRNALSEQLVAELAAALDDLARDSSVRSIVIAAAGPVFCAGHDLSEMHGRSAKEYRDLFGGCARVMHRLRELPKPVIARVQGMATAAGCQLVAACDLAVAADTAQFTTPGVKIGLFCTTPMVPLVRAIPAKPALEMLVTGHPMSAERAYELGLVNRVVPAADLDAAVDEYCAAIEATSPAVIALGKRAFYDQLPLAEREAYQRAVEVISDNAQLPDAQEGIAAFLEKRPPRWGSGQ